MMTAADHREAWAATASPDELWAKRREKMSERSRDTEANRRILQSFGTADEQAIAAQRARVLAEFYRNLQGAT